MALNRTKLPTVDSVAAAARAESFQEAYQRALTHLSSVMVAPARGRAQGVVALLSVAEGALAPLLLVEGRLVEPLSLLSAPEQARALDSLAHASEALLEVFTKFGKRVPRRVTLVRWAGELPKSVLDLTPEAYPLEPLEEAFTRFQKQVLAGVWPHPLAPGAASFK